MSSLVTPTYEGGPLTDEQLLDMCMFLFLAGLDTVAAALTWSVYDLAVRPDLQERIASDGAELSAAFVEELLRFRAQSCMCRTVRGDFEIAGETVRTGDLILLAVPAAVRDPAVFAHPDVIDPDRRGNRHLAFGIGAHRCLGAFLARLELQVALGEWHRAFPSYRVADGFVPPRRGGTLSGLDALRLAL